MGEIIIEFLRDINIGQLIALSIIGWFFYCRLDKKIIASKTELKAEISKLSDKIEDVDRRLSDKVEDVDRRLCRIEGSLSTQWSLLISTKKGE